MTNFATWSLGFYPTGGDGVATCSAVGSTEEFVVTGLTEDTLYYFAVKASDDATPTEHNSLISNPPDQNPSVTTLTAAEDANVSATGINDSGVGR